MERITATRASRKFSEILNRAKYGGESFLVERNGEPMVEIRAATGKHKTKTVAGFVGALKKARKPDPDFAKDMEYVMAQSRTMYPRDPWAGVGGRPAEPGQPA